MNWKLILQLSLFGLIMAFGTISLIPQKFEPIFWAVIFIFCAYVIAKTCTGKYFGHGFMVSIFNCFWILLVHILFFNSFMLHHTSSMDKMPVALQTHPRQVMIIFGAIIGVVSGLVLGLFAYIASKIVKKEVPTIKA